MSEVVMLEVVAHGLRWINNILVELSSNYGHVLSDSARKAFRVAIESMANAMDEVRKDQMITRDV